MATGGPEVAEMHAFMEKWNNDLIESGEFVDAKGLSAPVHARRISLKRRGPGRHRRPLSGDPGGPGRLHDRRDGELRPGHRDRRAAGRTPRPGGGEGQHVDVRPIVEHFDDMVEPDLCRATWRTCCATTRRGSSRALVRRYGHFDTAEDAVQEALPLAAARQWPEAGLPENPRGPG